MIKLNTFAALTCLLAIGLAPDSSEAGTLCAKGTSVVFSRNSKCPRGSSAVSIGAIKDFRKVQGLQGAEGAQGPMGPQGAQGAQGAQGLQGLSGVVNTNLCYTKRDALTLGEHASVFKLQQGSGGSAKTVDIRRVTLSCNSANDILLHVNLNRSLVANVYSDKSLYSPRENSDCRYSSDASSETCTAKFVNGHEFFINDQASSDLKNIASPLSITCCTSVE